MKRIDLEHIIRAAGSITQDDEIIIIGSQAVLGQFPSAPEALLRSMEADIYPKNKRHLSDLIEQGLVQKQILRERIAALPVEGLVKDRILKIIRR